MPQKIAVVSSLIVFAFCLVAGGIQAGNSFTTTVYRALTAMAITLAVGWVIGWMAQKMLDENLRPEEEKLKIPEPDLARRTDK